MLCGRSSGAELALLAAYEPEPIPIRAVISYYGPTDLTRGYYDRPTPDPIDVRSVLATFLGGSPAQVPAIYRDASPVNHVGPGLPPTLLIQGRRDHLVKAEFASELYDKLRAAKDTVSLIELPWSEHGFDFAFGGLGNQVSLGYVDDFLRETVGR